MRRPVSIATIDNFSLPQIQRAATLSGYTVGLIFSTKYDPPHLLFSLGQQNERLDRRSSTSIAISRPRPSPACSAAK